MIHSSADRPCLTLVHGLRADLPWYLRGLHTSITPVVHVAAPWAIGLPVEPMGGARQWFAQLRARAGEDAVVEALLPHRALLSLTLRGLVPTLDASEQRTRAHHRGLYLGHLPSTGLHPRPMVEAWGAVLGALFHRTGAPLWIPDASALDLGSLAVVRVMLRRPPASQRPCVVLGVPTDPTPSHTPVTARMAALRADEVYALEVLPVTAHVRFVHASHTGSLPSPDPLPPRDALDDGLEARALARLTAELPYTPTDLRALRDAARASFDAFGFAAALLMSEAALVHESTDVDVCEMHTLAAIAGLHVAPPRGAATDPLLVATDRHLHAAAALETDPRRRAHLAFRQTLRATRGAGELANAMDLAHHAVACSQDPSLSVAWQDHLGAWCHNARAYVNFRLGQGAAAARDCEHALTLASRCTPDDAADGPTTVDVGIVRFHIENNLSRLAWDAGDRAGAVHWQGRCFTSESSIPVDRRTMFRWNVHGLDLDDLTAASARLTAWHSAARSDWDLAAATHLAHDLAAVCYRRGDAVRAQRLFTETLDGWLQLAADPDDVFSARLNVAVTAYRAGDHGTAMAGFNALRGAPQASDPGTQADLHGALALVAASAGDAGAASHHVEEARALSASVDDPGVRARVARSVGDTWRRLGHRDRAAEVYRDGLRHHDDAGGDAPEDRLGLLLGLHATTGDDGLLDAALHLLPDALNDANAWWDLAALHRAVAGCVAPRSPEVLAVLTAAWAQRIEGMTASG